ncbi:MAG: histidinol phosphate phosphatase domain-containing protein [Dehalococcoidia bacterium]|nr:histidinol phosphate phosphatase domain-containing protein [Dehalococcoidia bacterium]
MLCDFHTHSTLSDGSLSPMELIHRSVRQGYSALGITDHMGVGGLESYLAVLVKECQVAEAHWGIMALPGVELTHLPPGVIGEAARTAKELGARLVVVHGETIVEPVPAGTNLAALSCPDVDVLAHPGLLTPEEARLAAANGIFLEISARKGHCLGNGRVVTLARKAGARLLINSDSHDPGDLLTVDFSISVAMGAGLDRLEVQEDIPANVAAFLERLGLPQDRLGTPAA